jgi:Flp pilus assembly protein CpaB
MVEPQKTSLLPKTAVRTLVLAVVIGIVGIVLLTVYLRSRDKIAVKVSVAMAAKPLVEGDTIRHGMLLAKDVPKDLLGGRFVSGRDIISVEGRVVGVDMDAGQPLYWNAIPLSAEGGYDRYLRPENRERAFAISIVGPPTRRGDVVDILGTYAKGSQRQAFEVLPAVTVIDRIGSTQILSVTQDEQLLLLAAQPCNLTLSIRSKLEPEDDVKPEPVNLSEVLPRARALGRARIARLREEGSIKRDR